MKNSGDFDRFYVLQRITVNTMLKYILFGILSLDGLETLSASFPDTENTTLPPPEKFNCGKFHPTAVITNTKNSDISHVGQFPWHVECLISGRPDKFSGSLIHPKMVLTLAAILHRTQPQQITVRAGEWTTATMMNVLPIQIRDVLAIINNEHYSAGDDKIIALLVLSEPFNLAENVNTVCLPSPADFFDTSCCFSRKFKDEEPNSSSVNNDHHQIELSLVLRDKCRAYHTDDKLFSRFWNGGNLMCAGIKSITQGCMYPKSEALVCPFSRDINRFVQAGILFFNSNCSIAGRPGVFGSIQHVRSWIDQQMEDWRLDKLSYIIPPKNETLKRPLAQKVIAITCSR